MSAVKVSIEFLDGPVSGVIKQCTHIAASMTNNKIFNTGPVSSEGLITAVKHLSLMEKKVKGGRASDVENRNIALGDVDDYIRQLAGFLNRYSFGREELQTTGFLLIESSLKKPARAESVMDDLL